MIWVQNVEHVGEEQLASGEAFQVADDVVRPSALAPYGAWTPVGDDWQLVMHYPGTQAEPVLLTFDNLNPETAGPVTYIGGGGFGSFIRNVVAAVVGTAAFGVGAASGANVAVNVVEGNQPLQNADIAAGLDVAGLAAGAVISSAGIGIAADSAFSEAAQTTAVASEAAADAATTGITSTGLATVGGETGAETIIAETGLGGVAGDTAAATAATNFIPTVAEVEGAISSASKAIGVGAAVNRLVNPPSKPKPVAPPSTVAIAPGYVTPSSEPAPQVGGFDLVLLALFAKGWLLK